jgi:hypothetical protein
VLYNGNEGQLMFHAPETKRLPAVNAAVLQDGCIIQDPKRRDRCAVAASTLQRTLSTWTGLPATVKRLMVAV